MAACCPTPAAGSRPQTDGGSRWLTVQQAAARLGRSQRHVRRLCMAAWAADGLAQRRSTADGQAWVISEDAHPSLSTANGRRINDAASDDRFLTDAQRRLIVRRKQILDDWQAAVSGGVRLGFSADQVTAQFIQRLELTGGERVSRSTLYKWRAAWRRDGLSGLIDARRDPRGFAGIDESDQFIACVLRAYLTDRAPSLTDCHWLAMETARERGWKTWSYHQVRRYIKTLPRQLIIMKREGEDAFVDKCEPWIARDHAALESNEIWCGDDHRFDVWVVEPGGDLVRPYITGWEDLRSRMLVGWAIYTHAPNADVILKAWVDGVRKHGLPAHVYVDNGKTYDASQLQGRTKKERRDGVDLVRQDAAWAAFDVKVHHAWPYHGQSKAIERVFGTICQRFSKWFSTYCGGSPQTRPDGLATRLDSGEAPTLAEFTRAFADWVDGVYHALPHSGDGMGGRSPREVFDACLRAKVTVPDEILRFRTLPRFGPVTVGQHGVVWHGMHYGGFDAIVQSRFGRKVMLAVDADDISSVLVLDLDGRLIGRARKNLKLTHHADRQTVRAAIAEKKTLRRTMRQYLANRPHMADDMHAIVARKAAQARAAEAAGPSDPPPAKIHPAAFDDRLNRDPLVFDERAKLAAGAERTQSFRYIGNHAEDDAAADAPFNYNGHGPAKEES